MKGISFVPLTLQILIKSWRFSIFMKPLLNFLKTNFQKNPNFQYWLLIVFENLFKFY